MESNLDRQLHASDYGQEMKERQVIEANVREEVKFVGRIRHTNGWTLFEINQKTLEITPATFREQKAIGFDGKPVGSNKVDMKQGCFYMEALNYKWAMSKYLKLCGIGKKEEQCAFLLHLGIDPKKTLPKEIFKKGLERLKK